MKRKYKTFGYIPHSKYIINVYDANNELVASFDRYKEVANFFERRETYIAEYFSKETKTIYYKGRKYYLKKIRNDKENYFYGKNKV